MGLGTYFTHISIQRPWDWTWCICLRGCYETWNLFYSHLNPKAMRLNMVYLPKRVVMGLGTYFVHILIQRPWDWTWWDLPKGLLWDLELILFTSQSKGHEVDVAYAHSTFGLNSHFGLVVLTILDYKWGVNCRLTSN